MTGPTSRALLALVLFGLAGCDQSPTGPEPPTGELITSFQVNVNPSRAAPLAAEVVMTTSRVVSARVTVAGQGGPALEAAFDDLEGAVRLPVLGLYPGRATTVRIDLVGPDGAILETRETEVTGQVLSSDFPEIDLEVASGPAPGVTLVSYFGHNSAVTPQRAFAFDAAGDIRWALDFQGHPDLGGLFFDNGVERLENGNLYFGDRNSNRIYEVTMLGRVAQSWAIPGFRFHHQVKETARGTFVLTVDLEGAATIEDHVIEIDRATGEIVTVWDLRRLLDQNRRAWPTDIADLEVDWFHGNGLDAYSDGSVVVSGRTQGIVKVTPQQEVAWILAPHRGWQTAGDGTDLSAKLLQPLDAAGQPITDPAVLDGTATHPDFEWAWYQHAPKVLSDGTLLVFDNGDNRGYGGQGTYSRAVQYRIDENAMTIQQVWTYGRERGAETYSRIVSDVDALEDANHVLFSPGAARGPSGPVGRIVEVDRASKSVVWEAVVRAPQVPFGITFHRAERLSLYPD